MTISVMLLYVAFGLMAIALVLFPDFRKKLVIMCGGFLNLFIEDKAKTPDGARAIYQQAIERAQVQYNEAHDMLQKTSGKLECLKKDLTKAQAELKDVEAKCESLVRTGKIDNARVLAEKREEIIITIEQYDRAIQNLAPMVNDAKIIANKKEQVLRKLKTDSKNKIAELEMNQEMGEMYDQMTDLKKRDTVSKLLESIDDGCIETRQKAVGAKVVYENRLDTKVNKALLEAKNTQGNDYITNLQNKRGVIK